MAEEVLGEYCDRVRNRLIEIMENSQLQDETEAASIVRMLHVVRQFRNNAQSFIDQGKIAEKELREDGEDA